MRVSERTLDMQGGDRNDLMAMNAVVELLEGQRVYIKRRIAIKFNGSNKKHVIQSVEDQYNIYNLLTAYRVFRKYGWGDELAAYFENMKESEVTKEDRAIVKEIRNISDSIKNCNVEDFDKALRALGENIKIREQNQENTQMNFIMEEIKEDFRELLEEQETLRYVHQIEWCLKKNFYQQAVTILESKMPTEYVWNGLKYYCTAEDDKNQAVEDFIWIYKNIISEKKSNSKYKMKDINGFVITFFDHDVQKTYKKYCREQGRKPVVLCQYGIEKQKVVDSIEKYKKICKIRNQLNHATPKEHQEDGFFVRIREVLRMEASGDNTFEEERLSEKEQLEMIKIYLKNFKELAKQVPQELKDKIVDLS